MFINRALKQCLIITPLALAMGCGGSSKSAPMAASPSSGNFSLAVTDGPVDSATKVVVEFTGVALKPVEGEIIEFTFESPVSIDLLTLQGHVSQYILAAESVPAGDYEWVRLAVTAEQDGIMDSYLELNDGTQLELSMPGGAETGLKLVSGFTVPEEGDADFTVDFDLRKSIVVKDDGETTSAMLKPALRIVDTISAGSIEGEVDALTVAENCANPDVNSGAVYVFAKGKGHSDVRGGDADPLASALVKFEDGAYRYELGFVSEGDYRIAFTCDAALDDPEAEDQLTFVDATSEHVKVTVGENVIVDFIPGETLPKGGAVPGADKSDEGGKPEAPGKPEVPAEPVEQSPEMPEGETPAEEAPAKPAAPGKPEVPGKPETPDVQVPEIEVPEVETPEVDAPDQGKPEMPGKPAAPGKPATPEAELPEVEMPEVEVPEVEVPELEVPELEAPETEAPEAETPKQGKPTAPGKPDLPQLPEVEAPDAEMPEVDVPEMETPEVEAPEAEAPSAELPEAAAGKGRQDKVRADESADEQTEADDADEELDSEEVESEETDEAPQA